MEREALLAQVRSDLREAGVDTDPPERLVVRIADYACLVASWAPRINLTGARDSLDIVRRFVIPPMIWAELLPTRPASFVDIGSGAGFPGIPLALRFPESDVVSVEARERRHFFQRQVVRELGLGRVHPILGRAEALEVRECEVGVAQALAPLPQAVSSSPSLV